MSVKGPSRLDQTAFARWWWSVDQTTLVILWTLVAVGFLLLLAAGPAAAARLNIGNSFYFPIRQALFILPALTVLFGVSLLTPLQTRRLGVLTFAASLFLMVVVLIAAPEINGAKRWLPFGVASLQPSELLKPGFVIVAAWMLAEGKRNPSFPGAMIAMALFAVCAALLIMQPDFGQAALLTAVWMVMFFIAGWSIWWLAGLFASACAMIAGGYLYSPHLAQRINGFLNPSVGDNYQVDKSVEAIGAGGLTGAADRSASIRHSLPDAHTDFIFAVGIEQHGVVMGLAIMALFAAFVVRAFLRAVELKSVFTQCAVCGLAAMIGLQAFINIGVSMRALPAKGMTLPFISYGGSSLLATGLAVGMILALTRRRGVSLRRREVMP
ncbi:MAG: putative peptidoglycan glycosyltransferase FtsW [Pseudomonadota bacterium]